MTPTMTRPTSRFTIAALLLLLLLSTARAQAPRQLDAAETQAALRRLSVAGSVLYVGAHPDDENTALLAYLARGRGARTAYLSLTRGDGGQNILGSGKGAVLGVVRTQELLAAPRATGARALFPPRASPGRPPTAAMVSRPLSTVEERAFGGAFGEAPGEW